MPRSLRIEITGRCNLSCLYCHAARLSTREAVSKEMNINRILELIQEGKALGCTEFTLIGGEPFLNKNWPMIVHACGPDSVVNITTNGHLFTPANRVLIHKLPQIKEFRVSLDGLASHDLVREGSSYRQILSTLDELIGEFPERRFVVQTTCNAQNLDELMSLYYQLKKIRIHRWRISQLWNFGRTAANADLLEFGDFDHMFEVYKRLILQFLADDRPFQLGIYNVYNSQITAEDYIAMDLDTHPCLYHFESICVKADGGVTFCPALDIPFASVIDGSLLDALKADWLTQFKKMTIKSVHCRDCRYIKLCGGGCRADAFAWLGGIEELDPVACCLMVRVERDIVPILSDMERGKYLDLINQNGSFPPVSGKNTEQAVQQWLSQKRR